MKYVVDRITSDIAVLEGISDKSKVEIEVSLLPSGINEGCVVIKNAGAFSLDKSEEAKRRASILKKFNRAKAGRDDESIR